MSKRDRNALILILTLCALFVGSSAGFESVPFSINRRSNPRRPHVALTKTPIISSLRLHTSLMILRGGAFPLSKSLVAKLCSGFLALNGASLLLAPILFVGSLYKIDIQKDTLETYLLQGFGAISIGMAINVYLVLIQKMPVQRAMGFALLPRLFYVIQSSLLGNNLEKAGGSKQFLSVNAVFMTWATFSLLTGVGNPSTAAKVFSSMAFFKGAFLIVNPVAASTKFFGINVSKKGMNKSRALCRGLGNVLTTSALLMGTLAFGVNPVKAAGYTCLLWVLLIADMTFLKKTYLLMGESSPLSQIIHLVIATFFTAGFLLT